MSRFSLGFFFETNDLYILGGVLEPFKVVDVYGKFTKMCLDRNLGVAP